MKKVLLAFVLIGLTLNACAPKTPPNLLGETESQVKLRSIQTRSFDTADRAQVQRAVISTMQDLAFVIEKADSTLGNVTGTKFHKNMIVKMTVTVRERGPKQTLVRANAQYGLSAVEDPLIYQDFFNLLSKSLFLAANQVD
jgi:hypothetical protein